MKTGLFLSKDNGNISNVVDIDFLANEYTTDIVSVVVDNFFEVESQNKIINTIKEQNLKSVVLAGNSPNYYEDVLSANSIIDRIKEFGIRQNAISFANIREQVAFPHSGSNGSATYKAKLLIDVAIEKIRLSHENKVVNLAPRRSVLIIGINPGGIIAGTELLKKGYRVTIIDEKEDFNPGDLVKDQILPAWTFLNSSNKSDIRFGTAINELSGWSGDFKAILLNDGNQEEVSAGGIILSVGTNTGIVKQLKPLLGLDTDENDDLAYRSSHCDIGSTKDPCIWVIPGGSADMIKLQSYAAYITVMNLSTFLDKPEIEFPQLISEVDEKLCGGCGTCIKTCAFSASSIDPLNKLSHIDENKCKGCGNCVVSCPTSARDLVSFPMKYLFKAIKVLSEGTKSDDPKILLMLCKGCGYPACDNAGELARKDQNMSYSENILPLQVECGGNVDTEYILSALNEGFAGVAISICRDNHCHHIVGNTDMERRVSLFREVLRSRSINDNRVRIVKISPHEGNIFGEEMRAFTNDLNKLI